MSEQDLNREDNQTTEELIETEITEEEITEEEIAEEAAEDVIEEPTEPDSPAAEPPRARPSKPIDLVERMDNPLWRAPLRRAKASRAARAKKFFLTLLLLVCLGVFVYAGYQLFLIGREYIAARVLYKGVTSSYTTMTDVTAEAEEAEDAEADETEPVEETPADELPDWFRMLSVDFPALQGYNADAAAWLYLEGSDIINYPVMFSGNNSAYLRTSIDKKYALAGSIFLDGSNTPDFTDAHSLVYGHQMRDGSMFGTLQKYKEDENYYPEHMYFQIRTPEKAYRFQIFSYYDVSASNPVYTIYRETGTEEYGAWVEKAMAASYRSTGVTVTNMDRVVTLSTCSDDNDRFVVHGVLVGTVDTAE